MDSSSIPPPASKKMKHEDPVEDQQAEDQVEKVPILKAKGLTSDAHISKDQIVASQLAQQPANIWYGKRRARQQDNDEPDAPYVVDCILSKGSTDSQHGDNHKSTAVLKKGICSRGGGGDGGSGSSSDAEDGGSCDYAPPWSSAPLLRGIPAPAPTTPTGKRTTIAILDSGINVDHATFQMEGCVSRFKISSHSKCFVGEPEDIADQLGHGTQCAGLVCGSPDIIQTQNVNETVSFNSIAPDARVMVCKVVRDGTEIADIQAVCDAIDHVISYNRNCESIYDKVNVISLSFGMEGFNSELTKKIQEAVYEDIIVICAASNNGKRVRQPITYPARLGHVLCIGACTEHGKPTDFSPVGRELDFLACGERVWAPTIGGSRNYCIVNGTSFAAPLVGGIVCQLVEDLRRLSKLCAGEEPALWKRVHNVWCVRELLKEMAAVQGKHSEESGFGALDPMEYFQKDDIEKLRIITHKILKP